MGGGGKNQSWLVFPEIYFGFEIFDMIKFWKWNIFCNCSQASNCADTLMRREVALPFKVARLERK